MKKNKFTSLSVVLIFLFVLNYFSFGFFGLTSSNVYVEFTFWLVTSAGAFITSLISLVKEKMYLSGTLILFTSLFFIAFTIFAFLLPEAGIPPLIQF